MVKLNSVMSSLRIRIDPTNPGQFFACCGLLELADRLWPGSKAWFVETEFCIASPGQEGAGLRRLIDTVLDASLTRRETDNDYTTPLLLGAPFHLHLDWWRDTRAGGSTFKTWAGQQKVVNIATAMHRALERAIPLESNLLQLAEVIPDPEDPRKSVAPFYFDARRAAGAHNLDIGFSTDAQKIDTLSFPAVEFLCLVGLQRFRAKANADRTFTYQTWSSATPLEPALAAPVACGAMNLPGTCSYSFRLLFRTKYLKGFLPAIQTR